MFRNIDFSDWGPATTVIVVIVAFCAAAGAVVTVINPETLSFEQYLNDMEKFVLGTGILAGARALHKSAEHLATRGDPSHTADATDWKGANDHPGGEVA